MANLSKEVFYKYLTHATPCHIYHPNTNNCFEALKYLSWNLMIGCSKFYVGLYAIKVLLQKNRLDRKYIFQQIYSYLRTVFYAYSMGLTFYGSLCMFWNIDVSYYTAFRAGMLSGTTRFLEMPENKTIDILLFGTQAVEIIINHLRGAGFMPKGRLKSTLAFMAISAAVMFLFKRRENRSGFTNLWFYKEKTRKSFKERCQHTEKNCTDYWIKGIRKYFILGYCVDTIRNVLPKAHLLFKTPIQFTSLLVTTKSLKLALFLSSYAALYRSITCTLSSYSVLNPELIAVIAGYVSGGTFYLKPDIQFVTFGIVTLIQLLWKGLTDDLNTPAKETIPDLVFCIICGILMQYRFILPDYCPQYTKNLFNLMTNGLSSQLHAQFVENVFKQPISKIVPDDVTNNNNYY